MRNLIMYYTIFLRWFDNEKEAKATHQPEWILKAHNTSSMRVRDMITTYTFSVSNGNGKTIINMSPVVDPAWQGNYLMICGCTEETREELHDELQQFLDERSVILYDSIKINRGEKHLIPPFTLIKT